MNVVESKHVREIMNNRIKVLEANGQPYIAEQLIYDIGKIMQYETFISIDDRPTIRADRLGRIREANND